MLKQGSVMSERDTDKDLWNQATSCLILMYYFCSGKRSTQTDRDSYPSATQPGGFFGTDAQWNLLLGDTSLACESIDIILQRVMYTEMDSTQNSWKKTLMRWLFMRYVEKVTCIAVAGLHFLHEFDLLRFSVHNRPREASLTKSVIFLPRGYLRWSGCQRHEPLWVNLIWFSQRNGSVRGIRLG